MSLYRIVDRLALAFALMSSLVFLSMQESEAAIVSLAFWPLTRAVISVLDVFFLFFTQEPLVRSSAHDANVDAKERAIAKR